MKQGQRSTLLHDAGAKQQEVCEVRLSRYVMLFSVLSFIACAGLLYAEEAKPAESPGAEIKAPVGKDLDKTIKAATEQAANAPEKEAPKAEAAKEPPPPDFTGSASVAFLNRYIFRGYRIGESGLVIQPSVSASYKGFTFTYWGNYDTHQTNTTTATFSSEGQSGYNETDLTLSLHVCNRQTLPDGRCDSL